jgi:D-tyrosyl-tRNA(Tyr) deacylase
MRAVIQRVSRAEVRADGEVVGKIGKGLLVLLAIHRQDEEGAIAKMADRVTFLRIFDDGAGKMNLSVKDLAGEILVVSQFTLYGDAKGGNRPSFLESARPEKAVDYYDKFVTYLRENRFKVETGKFGATMEVELVNDGPTTIILDS